jgi:DNA-binding transcriptional LysR family regulator
MNTFKLSSDQCELLAAFESAGSIKELALRQNRDESVISRQIKHIAETAPTVLEKNEKRWVLSSAGKRITQWTRESIESQNRLLQGQTSLRIATTREFSSKILVPNLRSLLKEKTATVSILTSDDGIEKELLSGRADIGIDCGRPEDPLIRFKTVLPEPYVVVASPAFLRKHGIKTKDELLRTPHLKFNRDSALRLLELQNDLPNIAMTFNDLSSLRVACCKGLGWATLPRYTVLEEVKKGDLRSLTGWSIQPRSFGVWWVRERRSSMGWVEDTIQWLSQQKL